jgi:GGDEF domain-containing protein
MPIASPPADIQPGVIEDVRQQPAPRSRPLADLPLDALVAASEELAKRWAAALILTRPLSQSAEIPLEDLAREAPSLCARMLRAVESDAELERLTASVEDGGREQLGLARVLGQITGAGDATAAVAAVEALRGVLWEALQSELRWPMFDSHARLLLDLADRLSYVCSMSLAAAIPALLAPEADPHEQDAEVIVAAGGPPVGPWERDEAEASGGQGGVVIVDERPQAAPAARGAGARVGPPAGELRDPPPRREARQPASGPASWEPPTPVSSMGSLLEPSPRSWEAAPPNGARAGQDEIEIRDERIDEGPAAWIRSIGRQLERFAQDARPFSVLLIELIDIERVPADELSAELLRLAGQVEHALAEELQKVPDRPAGSLTREAPGRYWLIAPETDALGVRVLAEQLARAARTVSRRWLPLEVAIGTALCPDDGLQAAALAAHADVALYAARAEGSGGGGAAG